ncbi:MAG: enoyl-CoA hydratase/isomerase family protein, partial [Actinobacteria bacterium]|nr:enoyl-CoA hydratase/isomerase family protein [Actinomycetota bacterium]
MTTDSNLVLVDVADGIATVTLNRPEVRNALSIGLRGAIHDTMAEVDGRDDVDVIVLTGAGPAFCAGLDL